MPREASAPEACTSRTPKFGQPKRLHRCSGSAIASPHGGEASQWRVLYACRDIAPVAAWQSAYKTLPVPGAHRLLLRIEPGGQRNGLELEITFESLATGFTTEPRLFAPAKRSAPSAKWPFVNDARTGLHLRGDLDSSVEVGRVHRASQPVLGVVRNRHCLLHVVVIEQTDYRPEDLFLRNELSTSAKMVGSTYQPVGRSFGRPPPKMILAPCSKPDLMYPSTRSR